MDHSKVEAFLGQFVVDLGATGAAGQVVIGHRLGLYGSLAEGPATPEQFAERTGYARRYLTEWLRGQAAGGYVSYDPATGEFSLTEEQAFCLADRHRAPPVDSVLAPVSEPEGHPPCQSGASACQRRASARADRLS